MTAISLASRADALLAAAFADLGLSATHARSVVSARPELADRQCNGAMPAAKAAGLNPREVAGAIAARLSGHHDLAEVSVAGPGFVNIKFSDTLLAEAAASVLADPAIGVSAPERVQRILIDFGGPNVAKPLHVGHMRSLVIGESLRRILGALGHHAESDVHLGDWGLQMGMLISEIRLRQPELSYFAEGANGPWPDAAPVSVDELERMYPAAAAACKADPARMALAREATAALQAGHAGSRALWQRLRALSLEAQERDFEALGAHFDLLLGESDAQPMIPGLVADLLARGVAVESEGALIVEVAEPGETKPMPPLLLAKTDGAALYATTDLATLADRVTRLGMDRILYVVDQRQSLHFEQVFRAARKGGIAGAAELAHVGFGTVNGPDGKPFKTRDGGVAKLADLVEEAVAKAAERLSASEQVSCLPEAERATLARQVGVAALKFADLSGARTSGYVFDADRLVSFEGKTGPYLQYACVRIGSILAKAKERGAAQGPILIGHASERALVLECLRMPEVLASAGRSLMPNEVAEHAFALAQKFSRFYADCPVLGLADGVLRASRLSLCSLAHATLARELYLLGIEVPARM